MDPKKPWFLPIKKPKKKKRRKNKKQKEEYKVPEWAEDRKILVEAIK